MGSEMCIRDRPCTAQSACIGHSIMGRWLCHARMNQEPRCIIKLSIEKSVHVKRKKTGLNKRQGQRKEMSRWRSSAHRQVLLFRRCVGHSSPYCVELMTHTDVTVAKAIRRHRNEQNTNEKKENNKQNSLRLCKVHRPGKTKSTWPMMQRSSTRPREGRNQAATSTAQTGSSV